MCWGVRPYGTHTQPLAAPAAATRFAAVAAGKRIKQYVFHVSKIFK